jgi:hypothetical protein
VRGGGDRARQSEMPLVQRCCFCVPPCVAPPAPPATPSVFHSLVTCPLPSRVAGVGIWGWGGPRLVRHVMRVLEASLLCVCVCVCVCVCACVCLCVCVCVSRGFDLQEWRIRVWGLGTKTNQEAPGGLLGEDPQDRRIRHLELRGREKALSAPRLEFVHSCKRSFDSRSAGGAGLRFRV